MGKPDTHPQKPELESSLLAEKAPPRIKKWVIKLQERSLIPPERSLDYLAWLLKQSSHKRETHLEQALQALEKSEREAKRFMKASLSLIPPHTSPLEEGHSAEEAFFLRRESILKTAAKNPQEALEQLQELLEGTLAPEERLALQRDLSRIRKHLQLKQEIEQAREKLAHQLGDESELTALEKLTDTYEHATHKVAATAENFPEQQLHHVLSKTARSALKHERQQERRYREERSLQKDRLKAGRERVAKDNYQAILAFEQYADKIGWSDDGRGALSIAEQREEESSGKLVRGDIKNSVRNDIEADSTNTQTVKLDPTQRKLRRDDAREIYQSGTEIRLHQRSSSGHGVETVERNGPSGTRIAYQLLQQSILDRVQETLQAGERDYETQRLKKNGALGGIPAREWKRGRARRGAGNTVQRHRDADNKVMRRIVTDSAEAHDKAAQESSEKQHRNERARRLLSLQKKLRSPRRAA